ncbi:hypothetical protein L2K20_09665 [Mycobacterium sp. MBM]|nr:hypothetical protein [Mycobacterium sp. MBM]
MTAVWSPRQTTLAVLVAVVIGIIGGGAVYAAADGPGHPGHPGGHGDFGPRDPAPRSAGG